VGHGEGGDGRKEHHPVLDDQQQAKDEEEVIDALQDLRGRDAKWYGLRSLREIDAVVRGLATREVDAVVIGAWTWSPAAKAQTFSPVTALRQ
jgi:hypothetical protein